MNSNNNSILKQARNVGMKSTYTNSHTLIVFLNITISVMFIKEQIVKYHQQLH